MIIHLFFLCCGLALISSAKAFQLSSQLLRFSNGSQVSIPAVTDIAFAPTNPNLLLVSTFTGNVILLRVLQPSPNQFVVTAVVHSIRVTENRAIVSLVTDLFSRSAFFIATVNQQWEDVGGWKNGRVEVVRLNTVTLQLSLDAEPLVTGLPVAGSGSQEGLLGLNADSVDGKLFITLSSHTASGVPRQNGPKDNVLSGAILVADIRTRGKTLALAWSSNDLATAIPASSPNISGISVFATGVRSAFEPIITTRGNLFTLDVGGDPEEGERSVSCTQSVPSKVQDATRVLRIVRGRWYGMANRARGRTDPTQCVHIWGDEANIQELRRNYTAFTPPIMTRKADRDAGKIGAAVIGLDQYRANWFAPLRNRLIGAEFDFTQALPNRQAPSLVKFDLSSRTVSKIADAPGLAIATSAYGAIFVGQFIRAGIAIANPRVTARMKTEPRIRHVWPPRGKPLSRIFIYGTSLPTEGAVFVGGRPCEDVRRRIRFSWLHVISCRVPYGGPYVKRAVSVRVGNVVSNGAYNVLPHWIDIVK